MDENNAFFSYKNTFLLTLEGWEKAMAKHYKLSDTPKIGCPKKCILWLEIMF